jgi:hypothetical protein
MVSLGSTSKVIVLPEIDESLLLFLARRTDVIERYTAKFFYMQIKLKICLIYLKK